MGDAQDKARKCRYCQERPVAFVMSVVRLDNGHYDTLPFCEICVVKVRVSWTVLESELVDSNTVWLGKGK